MGAVRGCAVLGGNPPVGEETLILRREDDSTCAARSASAESAAQAAPGEALQKNAGGIYPPEDSFGGPGSAPVGGLGQGLPLIAAQNGCGTGRVSPVVASASTGLTLLTSPAVIVGAAAGFAPELWVPEGRSGSAPVGGLPVIDPGAVGAWPRYEPPLWQSFGARGASPGASPVTRSNSRAAILALSVATATFTALIVFLLAGCAPRLGPDPLARSCNWYPGCTGACTPGTVGALPHSGLPSPDPPPPPCAALAALLASHARPLSTALAACIPPLPPISPAATMSESDDEINFDDYGAPICELTISDLLGQLSQGAAFALDITLPVRFVPTTRNVEEIRVALTGFFVAAGSPQPGLKVATVGSGVLSGRTVVSVVLDDVATAAALLQKAGAIELQLPPLASPAHPPGFSSPRTMQLVARPARNSGYEAMVLVPEGDLGSRLTSKLVFALLATGDGAAVGSVTQVRRFFKGRLLTVSRTLARDGTYGTTFVLYVRADRDARQSAPAAFELPNGKGKPLVCRMYWADGVGRGCVSPSCVRLHSSARAHLRGQPAFRLDGEEGLPACGFNQGLAARPRPAPPVPRTAPRERGGAPAATVAREAPTRRFLSPTVFRDRCGALALEHAGAVATALGVGWRRSGVVRADPPARVPHPPSLPPRAQPGGGCPCAVL